MLDTTADSCGSQRQLFTTRYSYGSDDQEFIFCCRGKPFAALVSPNLPTPTSSLLDYDFIKSLGLKLTDLQCKKFYFAGNKMRILGRVSTTVQCIQNGRAGSNFHIKGFVVSDLNKLLDTHCVAGNKMRQQIEVLLKANEVSETDNDDDDIAGVFNERKCEAVREPISSSASMSTSSSAPMSASSSATSRSSTGASRPSSSTFTPTAPTTSIPYNPGAIRTPIPPGIVAKPHSSLYAIVGRDDSYHDAMGCWEKFAEEKPFKTTWEDGKPRVVNVSHVGHDDMLRIGDWDQLEDPKGHQARHVLLANIRREAPDRVCDLCSYNLFTNHVCSDSIKNQNDVAKHCDDCCQKLRFIKKGGRYRWEIPPLEI